MRRKKNSPGNGYADLHVRITRDEATRLRAASRAVSLSVSDLVRMAISSVIAPSTEPAPPSPPADPKPAA